MDAQALEISQGREGNEVLRGQVTQLKREMFNVEKDLGMANDEIDQAREKAVADRQAYGAESARMNAQLREVQDVHEEVQREWRSNTTQNEARAQEESRLQEVQINSLLQQLDSRQIQLAASKTQVATHQTELDAQEARWKTELDIEDARWREKSDCQRLLEAQVRALAGEGLAHNLM